MSLLGTISQHLWLRRRGAWGCEVWWPRALAATLRYVLLAVGNVVVKSLLRWQLGCGARKTFLRHRHGGRLSSNASLIVINRASLRAKRVKRLGTNALHEKQMSACVFGQKPVQHTVDCVPCMSIADYQLCSRRPRKREPDDQIQDAPAPSSESHPQQ